MTVIQKTIGRLPVNLGDYNSTRAYGKKNRVLLYGCEWESKVNNNTYAPAALNTTTGVITPDTTHWKLISGSYNTWLIDNGYKKESASNVQDSTLNNTQDHINASIIGEIGSDSSANTIKGRIKTLETNVGSGGSVDQRIAAANSEIVGDAASDYNTLGKLEDKIQEEATRAQAAEADRYTKSETYTKEEVHNLITTPSQEYVSVIATDQTTSVTDVLPETGSADTIYRVGNWDGTQYNDSVLSEYAWNGSAYIKLSTKSQIGEVYDISANHADTKYADLAAALGTNGANIPQSLRKGGMSVKFVCTSDNKYVQCRLMADSFTTDTNYWSFCGNEVYIDNPEYIEAKTDAEGRLLEGIKTDGTKHITSELQVDGEITNQDENITEFVKSNKETLSYFENIDNAGWLEVTIDSENKVIEGTQKDGSKCFDEVNANTLNLGSLNLSEKGKEKLKEDLGFVKKDDYVLWLGTSIPEGCTYPQVSCENNGFQCINKAVGYSSLTFDGNHPAQVMYYSGRHLTATVAELEALYRQDVTNGVITEEVLEGWKNGSYERSVIPYINGTNEHQVSMIVIDHGYNDRDQIFAQMADVDNIQWDSEDRSTFTGAFRYLLNKIQEVNPFLKIVIGGYFTDTVEGIKNANTADYGSVYGSEICGMQKLLASTYNISIMKVWEESQISAYYVKGTTGYISGFNQRYGTSYERYLLTDKNRNVITGDNGNVSSFQLYCMDGIHPFTDLTGNSNKRLNAVYSKLLQGLIL